MCTRSRAHVRGVQCVQGVELMYEEYSMCGRSKVCRITTYNMKVCLHYTCRYINSSRTSSVECGTMCSISPGELPGGICSTGTPGQRWWWCRAVFSELVRTLILVVCYPIPVSVQSTCTTRSTRSTRSTISTGVRVSAL